MTFAMFTCIGHFPTHRPQPRLLPTGRDRVTAPGPRSPVLGTRSHRPSRPTRPTIRGPDPLPRRRRGSGPRTTTRRLGRSVGPPGRAGRRGWRGRPKGRPPPWPASLDPAGLAENQDGGGASARMPRVKFAACPVSRTSHPQEPAGRPWSLLDEGVTWGNTSLWLPALPTPRRPGQAAPSCAMSGPA